MNDLLNEKQPIEVFAQQAYLDYAMYVILDRALPYIGDGLKPVQRRIVYAMSELGLKHLAKYKKSARTIGDVIGKFHPHGDSACYEAMVIMAQEFNYRYPIIDGQGNWGSADDPKSFAAMRYTESKLTPYAQVFLKELSLGTVNWQPNFDGTLSEPQTLPSRVPNVLLNGSTGIAVGMTTDIPPHNIIEVIDACLLMLKDPHCKLDDVLEHIKGPDFPTGAEIITPKADIRSIYDKGTGNIKVRATYEVHGKDIIITQLPYQSSSSKIIKQIADQMQAKKMPMIYDVQDQSDYENSVRICISLKNGRVDVDEIMSHLFASTDLEKSLRIHLNIIGLDRKPKVMPLLELIREWLSFRKATVTKRCEHRLNQVLERQHILEGLLIIFNNLDEVIRIIRYEDDPKTKLMERFDLSEEQTIAILNTRLKHLAKLEQLELEKEHQELSEEQKELEDILKSPAKLVKLVQKELTEDKKEYQDQRRTKLVERDQAKTIKATTPMVTESISTFLSKNEWIRYGKGWDISESQLSYKTGDQPNLFCKGKSNNPIILLNKEGRSYSVYSHKLPSIRSSGEPISKFIQSNQPIMSIINAPQEQPTLVCSDNGYGFVTTVENMISKNKAGKQLLSLGKENKPLKPLLLPNDWKNYLLAIATQAGRLLIFSMEELPELNKGKGNKLVSLQPTDDCIQAISFFPKNSDLILVSGKRTFKLTQERQKPYHLKRARKGAKIPRGFARVDQLLVEKAQDENSAESI